MNLDFVETLRKLVAEEAVDLEMRNIPQLQVPAVEFVVPFSMEAGIVLGDMVRRLAPFPSVTARIVKKGVQSRIRIECRT